MTPNIAYHCNHLILLSSFIDFLCISYKLIIDTHLCIRSIKEYAEFNTVCGSRHLLTHLKHTFHSTKHLIQQ